MLLQPAMRPLGWVGWFRDRFLHEFRVLALELGHGLLLRIRRRGAGVAFLWARRDAGVVMSLLLLPLGMIFWLGFALLFGPVLGVAATVLALVARRARRRVDSVRAVRLSTS